MYRNSNKIQVRYSNIFLYITFLCFVLISSYKAPLSFDTPFPAIIVSLIFLFFYFVFNGKRRIGFHYIIILMLLRTFFFCVNVVVLQLEIATMLGELVTVLTCILVFVGVSNFGTRDVIKNTCLIFSLMISTQLVVGYIINGFSNKASIVSGIGASNYTAAFLVVCIAYLLFMPLKKYQWAIVILDVIMLLSTLSFGAYLALFVTFVVFIKKHFNWKKRSTRRNFFLTFVIVLFAIIAFLSSDIGSSIVSKITQKMDALLSGDWKVFGSSRIEVYTGSINNFGKHVLFGNIVNPIEIKHDHIYHFEDERAHNFLLESLVRYGLIGTILNASMLFITLKKCRKYAKIDKCAYAVLISFVAALIHGLVEPNFFTMHFELIVWLLAGSLFSIELSRSKSSLQK